MHLRKIARPRGNKRGGQPEVPLADPATNNPRPEPGLRRDHYLCHLRRGRLGLARCDLKALPSAGLSAQWVTRSPLGKACVSRFH